MQNEQNSTEEKIRRNLFLWYALKTAKNGFSICTLPNALKTLTINNLELTRNHERFKKLIIKVYNILENL